MNEINALITNYIDQNKYISCLEELYSLFEKNSISFEERKNVLIEIYKYNKKIYASEERKNEKLDKMENHKMIATDFNYNQPIITMEKSKKKVEPLKCDVTDYMRKIKKFNSLEELKSILPTKDNEQFNNIVDMILVNLYKEKLEIINFMNEFQANGQELDEYFDEELEDIDYRMETLIDYKNNNEQLDNIVSVSDCNKVVFLKNQFNEPIIFQNIKRYDEYYDSFLELINSIIDGSFKNIRMISNNNKISDVYEVKGFKTRILFNCLKGNTYVIMAALVKKCNTDYRHRNFLQNISQAYQIQKEGLIDLIENEEFMSQEEKYLDELIMTLKDKKKVMTK